jgi:hypothetical protein
VESLQELVHRESRLGDDGAQGSAREVAGMAGDHGDPAGLAIDPEFVAALAGAQLGEAVTTQAGHHVAVFERRQPAHAATGMVMGKSIVSDLVLRLRTRRNAVGKGSFSDR